MTRNVHSCGVFFPGREGHVRGDLTAFFRAGTENMTTRLYDDKGMFS